MVQLLSGSQRGDRPIVPTMAAAHDRLICHRAQDIIGTNDFQAEIETVPVNLRGTRIGHLHFRALICASARNRTNFRPMGRESDPWKEPVPCPTPNAPAFPEA